MIHDDMWWYATQREDTRCNMMIHDDTWRNVMIRDATWWYAMIHNETWWYMMWHHDTRHDVRPLTCCRLVWVVEELTILFCNMGSSSMAFSWKPLVASSRVHHSIAVHIAEGNIWWLESVPKTPPTPSPGVGVGKMERPSSSKVLVVLILLEY